MYLYGLAADFNRRNADARVELVDYTVYNTAEDGLAGTVRLAADMFAGNCPDIVMLEGISVASWAKRGMLLELNAFIDGREPGNRVRRGPQHLAADLSRDGALFQRLGADGLGGRDLRLHLRAL